MIIAVSDVHLGYSKSNKADFARFLDCVAVREDVTDLVLAGDILEFWRRDMVAATMENSDIIARLVTMRNGGMKIHYIAGNHDYTVRHLKIFPNRFKFSTKVELVEDGVKYMFTHGWELDSIQNDAFFDALCYCNDKYGRVADQAWNVYLKWIDDPQKRIIEWMRQYWAKRDMEKMMEPPEERGLVERGDVHTGQIVKMVSVEDEFNISGHTHCPDIIESENRANTGSWVRSAPVHNTYVAIDGNKLWLRRFI
jgi:UDP-2,3-diacylglucosamine pyrophosphatase LpxH